MTDAITLPPPTMATRSGTDRADRSLALGYLAALILAHRSTKPEVLGAMQVT